MKRGLNNSHVRLHNQRAIVSAIFERKSISKAELARELNLSKPTTADNIAILIEKGIVMEKGEGNSSGGRPPMLLQFCESFKYIIAIDFYYQNSIFAISNLSGEILKTISLKLTPLIHFEIWMNSTKEAISALLHSQGITAADLAAIAISSPGIMNQSSDSVIRNLQFAEFDAIRLKKELESRFRVEVLLKNGSNASALGEFSRDAERTYNSLAYISCGLGLGSGLIIDGRLYEGTQFAVGEIASFVDATLLNSGETMESKICIKGFLDRANRRREEINDPETLKNGCVIDFDTIIRLWERENPFIVNCVEDISTHVGCIIANVISLVNCERVVLGGEYLVFKSQMLRRINEIVSRYCIVPVEVTASGLGEHSSIYGMISCAREYFFDKNFSVEAL